MAGSASSTTRGTGNRKAGQGKPRLLLVNPPQILYGRSPPLSISLPTSLLSIAANVRDLCTVGILDCIVEDSEPKGLKVKSREGRLHGLGFEEIGRWIAEFSPDFIGIASQFSSQEEAVREVSRVCRKACPGAKIILGGPGAAVRFGEYLRAGVADYCVVGEGESVLREFFLGKRGIKGLARIGARGKIELRPRSFERNLDKLPLPAYDLVNLEKYLSNPHLYSGRGLIPERSAPIVTSRGCPYKCVFCSVHLSMGRAFRAHSPEYVLGHIKLLNEKYGVRNFHFEDDGLSLDRRRFERILNLIIGAGLKIRWDTPNGVRADTLDRALVRKMKESGCFQVKIGIESGNQQVLDKVIGKRLSLERVVSAARACKEEGLACAGFYVVGFPGETIENMEETTGLALKLLRKYDVFPHVFIATPIYGTELYKTCARKGYFGGEVTGRALSESTVSWGEGLIETGAFGKGDVQRVIGDFYRRARPEILKYFLRNPRIAARVWKLALRGGSPLFFLEKYFLRKGA